jgi:hypothetical protein
MAAGWSMRPSGVLIRWTDGRTASRERGQRAKLAYRNLKAIAAGRSTKTDQFHGKQFDFIFIVNIRNLHRSELKDISNSQINVSKLYVCNLRSDFALQVCYIYT